MILQENFLPDVSESPEIKRNVVKQKEESTKRKTNQIESEVNEMTLRGLKNPQEK